MLEETEQVHAAICGLMKRTEAGVTVLQKPHPAFQVDLQFQYSSAPVFCRLSCFLQSYQSHSLSPIWVLALAHNLTCISKHLFSSARVKTPRKGLVIIHFLFSYKIWLITCNNCWLNVSFQLNLRQPVHSPEACRPYSATRDDTTCLIRKRNVSQPASSL